MNTPKRGRGRPPKNPEDRRDGRLGFAVTEAERNALKIVMEEEGEDSVSSLLRKMLRRNYPAYFAVVSNTN